jgi:AraC-like DNA-binding protein
MNSTTIILLDICLLGVLFLRLLPTLRNRRSWFAAGLLLSSCAYLVAWYLHVSEMPRGLRMGLLLLVTSQPIFFWLLAMELFDDRFQFRWWHGIAILGKFALAGSLAFGRPISNIFSEIATVDYPRMIPNFFYSLAFVVHAMAIILRTNRGDLVEPRRRLRKVVLSVTGLLIVHAILTAAVLRPLGLGSYADGTALVTITAATVSFLAWGDALWGGLFQQATKPSTGNAEPEIMKSAVDAMTQQELFRTEGLTVTGLASKLGVQEYKLRRAINSGLGYRNFNEYLNFYRIRAARAFLENPENAAYPLIHLALDLGYPAPGPFNRAFKEATGRTPSEYRKPRKLT